MFTKAYYYNVHLKSWRTNNMYSTYKTNRHCAFCFASMLVQILILTITIAAWFAMLHYGGAL